MANYFLMHENLKIALFKLYNLKNIIRIELSQNPSTIMHLPVGVTDKLGLRDWLLNRGIPVTRQRLDIDLRMSKVSSPFELMLRNYGLSITDHYWIRPQDDSHTWESINLYINDFKSAYSLDLRDDKRSIAGKTNFVPSASLKGDLKKKWIIIKKNIEK